MKKKVILLILILSTANILIVEGQSRYFRKKQPKLGYGIKAGINYAWQSTTNKEMEDGTYSIVGINAGGYSNYFIRKQFAVQAELMVSGKGSGWKYEESEYVEDIKDILTYIDLPIMIRYQPAKFVNFHAGPQIGIKLNALQRDMEAGTKININEYYLAFDYGALLGVEANLPYNLNLTLRYVYGLFSANNTNFKYHDPWKNNFVQFSIGYRFRGQ